MGLFGKQKVAGITPVFKKIVEIEISGKKFYQVSGMNSCHPTYEKAKKQLEGMKNAE